MLTHFDSLFDLYLNVLQLLVSGSEPETSSSGGKEKSIMKKLKLDQDMPIGELKKIEDFLPPPNQLAIPEETVLVTLRLSESSVNFFKRQASKHRTKYQKMIRSLVDKYVRYYT